MHNYTISAHKNSSLFGALRIVEVLPQGKVQEEFISVAGKEIFTQHKTGYLNKEEGLIDLTLLQKISDLISRK